MVSKAVPRKPVVKLGVAKTSHQVPQVAEPRGSGLSLWDSYFQALPSHKVQKYVGVFSVVCFFFFSPTKTVILAVTEIQRLGF